MPLLLLPTAAGTGGAPVVPDVCPIGYLVVQSYPFGSVNPTNPLAGITLAMLVPKASVVPRPYPFAVIGIGTYPVSTIAKTNEPTVAIADLTVKIYPQATIVISPASPTATIDCKPSR